LESSPDFWQGRQIAHKVDRTCLGKAYISIQGREENPNNCMKSIRELDDIERFTDDSTKPEILRELRKLVLEDIE